MSTKPSIASLSLQPADALIRIQTLEEQQTVIIGRLEFTRRQLAKIERRERARRSKLRSWAQKIATKVANMAMIPASMPAKPATPATPAKAKRDVSQYPTVSYEEFEQLGLKAYPSNAIPGRDFVCWCYIDKREHRILQHETAYAGDFD